MQRRIVVVAMLGLIATGALPGVATATTPSVKAKIDEASEQWHDALGVRQDFATGATVVLEPVDGRQGEYRVATQEVVIDPSLPVAAIPEIVIHELSHHTFIKCGAMTMATAGADTPGIDVGSDAAAVVTRWLAGAPASVGGSTEQTPVPYAPESAAVTAPSADVAAAHDSEPVVAAEWATAPTAEEPKNLGLARPGRRMTMLMWRLA